MVAIAAAVVSVPAPMRRAASDTSFGTVKRSPVSAFLPFCKK